MYILLYHPPTRPIKGFVRLLTQIGAQVETCADAKELVRMVGWRKPEVLLCVWSAGQKELEAFLAPIKTAQPDIQCVVIGGEELEQDVPPTLAPVGVQQYYIEPFSFSKLIFDLGKMSYQGQAPISELVAGRFTVNLMTQHVFFAGKQLDLTRQQYRLLLAFLRRPNMAIGRAMIWETVWGFADYQGDNTVDALVYRLRRRLPKEAGCSIQPVYGFGYKFVA